MINTIRSEFIKLRTVLVHWALAINAAAFPFVISILVAMFGTFSGSRPGSDVATFIVALSVVTAMLLGAMAAISLTSEYNHNTIRPTFAATPSRLRVHASKLIVNTAALAAVSTIAIFASWFAAQLISSARDVTISLGDDDVVARLISGVVLAVLVGWFGYGLGLIIRNSPATVTILLLWPLLIESLIGLVFVLLGREGAVKWLPYRAAIEATASENIAFSDALGRPWGFVWFAAFGAVLIVIGAFLDNRRDA